MTREQAELKIKAAAYAVAAEHGANEATRLLDAVKNEINSMQWRGPENR